MPSTMLRPRIVLASCSSLEGIERNTFTSPCVRTGNESAIAPGE
jgi:hypothetical protein